jgi:hypothetical protein
LRKIGAVIDELSCGRSTPRPTTSPSGPTIGRQRTRRGTISSKADMEAGSVAGNRRGHWHAAAVLVLTAGMLAPQPAHAQRAEGSFQRTVTVSGSPDVEVVSGSGSIEVRQGTAGRVEIAGRINANDSWGWRRSQLSAEERVKRLEGTPPVEQRGKTVRIGHIEQEELRDGVSISYVVTVPRGTTLRTTTGSGSQEIDVDGSVEAHSGSGSLRIRRAGGLRASTGSGSVTAESIDAATHVTTGSGSIRVTKRCRAGHGKNGERRDRDHPDRPRRRCGVVEFRHGARARRARRRRRLDVQRQSSHRRRDGRGLAAVGFLRTGHGRFTA